MPAVVRPIAYDDLDMAVSIIQAGSLTPDNEDPERLDDYWRAVQETRARGGDVVVAETQGEVVGVCQVIVFTHFQHAGRPCCELESVHVRSDHRGKGIGALILGYAEQLARDAGCYRIQLTSRNVRVDAHRFYLTHGFSQTSQGFKKLLLD
ncbi:MAG: GNAT family N-acetyltransferase [Acidimicrobiales bacterium]